MESLLDSLSTERIEIDMVELSGIEFRHVDNRVMSLKLVQLGLAGAAAERQVWMNGAMVAESQARLPGAAHVYFRPQSFW